MPLNSFLRNKLGRVKKIAKEEGKGFLKNVKEGFAANLNPNVKGGVANFITQLRNLYRKK